MHRTQKILLHMCWTQITPILCFIQGDRNWSVVCFQLYGDTLFIVGIKKSIELQLKHSDAPIYFYQFSYDEKLGWIEKYIGDSSIPGMNFVTHYTTLS